MTRARCPAPSLLAVATLLGALTVSCGTHPYERGEWRPIGDANTRGYSIPEAEQDIFRGTLRHVPDSGIPTTVMRYNPYKIELPTDERATVVPPLTDVYGISEEEAGPLVGREVEIAGKLERQVVEGQFFIEIWPMRIRLVR